MKNKYNLLIVLLLLVLPYLFFFQPVFLSKTFVGTDIQSFFYPFESAAAEMYKSFQLHLWDPYIFCGMPTGAEANTAVFYPLNAFFFGLLPIFRAIANFIAFHLFLTSLFTYLYLREIKISKAASLMGALIFAYNGFSLMHVDQLSMLSVCTYLPLILLFIEKASKERGLLYPTLAGVAMGLQFLCGHAQMSAITCIAVALYVSFKLIKAVLSRDKGEIIKTALTGIFCLILGLALASIALLPFFSSYPLSLRSSGDFESSSAINISLSDIQTFLVPELRLNRPGSGLFGGTGETYAGVVPIFLGMFAAMYVRSELSAFFLALAAFSFFAALGKAFPLHYLLYHLVPFWGSLETPVRLLFLFMFSVSALAAMAVDQMSKKLDGLSKYAKGISAFGVCALLFFVIFISTSAGREFLLEATEGGLAAPLRFFAIFFTFAAAVNLFSRKMLSRTAFIALLIAITLVDLLSFSIRYFDIADDGVVSAKPAFFSFFEQDKDLYRVSVSLQEFPPNLSIAYKVQSISGYSPVILKDLIRYVIFDATGSLDMSRVYTGSRLYIPPASDTKMKGLLNVKYNVYPLEKDGMYYTGIAPLKNYYPRAFLAAGYEVIYDRDRILLSLRDEKFDPGKKILLEEGEGLSRYNFGASLEGAAQTILFSPDRINIKTRSNSDAFLFLSEMYYPGWKAYVDGAQAKIYRANFLFRAVPLKAGQHNVSFIYDPLSFKVGRYLSLFSLFICLGLIGYDRFYLRKRK
jgi:diacylglycerol kinase